MQLTFQANTIQKLLIRIQELEDRFNLEQGYETYFHKLQHLEHIVLSAINVGASQVSLNDEETLLIFG